MCYCNTWNRNNHYLCLYAYRGLCMFCFVCPSLRLVYPQLSVSLDCPFLIAPSVFSNVFVCSLPRVIVLKIHKDLSSTFKLMHKHIVILCRCWILYRRDNFMGFYLKFYLISIFLLKFTFLFLCMIRKGNKKWNVVFLFCLCTAVIFFSKFNLIFRIPFK
jgi:hypothetical protein